MSTVKRLFAAMLLLTAFCAGAADIKLPIKMEDVAARLKRNAPSHVQVSANNDELVIALSEVDRKGGFDNTYVLDLKRFADKKATFTIDVKLSDVAHDGRTPSSAGRLFFGDYGQTLSTRNSDWTTYTFKSTKISGNGMLKIRIALKNISGEVRIRNPHVKIDLPRPTKKRKKKKK